MKILLILGTRPEIIRLSRIIPKLDELVDLKILHTGQNYSPLLNDIFFDELEIRKPDIIVENKEVTFAKQLSNTFEAVEKCILEFLPDKVLILGDTNSGLSAVICERMGIPVYHMEAGNRCYDLEVPEEVNRKIIDSISSFNLPYTELSRQNLLREGIPNNRISVTGNPIREVLDFYSSKIDNSTILQKYNLEKEKYIIATAHRAENVDNPKRLENILKSFQNISSEIKIVFSCHPRTRQRLNEMNYKSLDNIIITEPMGFFDFAKLEKNAKLAITDSGTVQEEMCLFRIPTITIRQSTERPETVWCGSNIVSGLDYDSILTAFHSILKLDRNWKIPEEYLKNNVSDTVINLLLSNGKII